jgi:hypothetical protein
VETLSRTHGIWFLLLITVISGVTSSILTFVYLKGRLTPVRHGLRDEVDSEGRVALTLAKGGHQELYSDEPETLFGHDHINASKFEAAAVEATLA